MALNLDLDSTPKVNFSLKMPNLPLWIFGKIYFAILLSSINPNNETTYPKIRKI